MSLRTQRHQMMLNYRRITARRKSRFFWSSWSISLQSKYSSPAASHLSSTAFCQSPASFDLSPDQTTPRISCDMLNIVLDNLQSCEADLQRSRLIPSSSSLPRPMEPFSGLPLSLTFSSGLHQARPFSGLFTKFPRL